MDRPCDRLKDMRLRRGFQKAAEAATHHGWNVNTYKAHESGKRGLRGPIAEKYAYAYRVSPGWLLTGEGEPQGPPLISPDEARLLRGFGSLDNTGRATLLSVLDGLLAGRRAVRPPARAARR